MKVNAKQRKKANKGFEHAYGKDDLATRMFHILRTGKEGMDAVVKELGVMMAEAIMDMEREELSGPEYSPRHEGVYKWAYQQGSIYLVDQKVPVQRPRLRGPEGEIPLQSYRMLKDRQTFSEELVQKILRGVSERKYRDTVYMPFALVMSPSALAIKAASPFASSIHASR